MGAAEFSQQKPMHLESNSNPKLSKIFKKETFLHLMQILKPLGDIVDRRTGRVSFAVNISQIEILRNQFVY